MKHRLLVLGCVWVLLFAVHSHAQEAPTAASADALTLAPQFQSIMDSVNSQVNQALSSYPPDRPSSPPLDPLASAPPPIVPPPTDDASVPRFVQSTMLKDQGNLRLFNSLDLATMQYAQADPKPEKHPHQVVAAFAAIALETIHRGRQAWLYIRSQIAALQTQIKVEKHDLSAWVSNQHTAAVYRLHEEKERIAKLTDEEAHLTHVYQDAVAKEKSYQTQSNQIVAERQLQHTPPIMPAVAAASLTDAQFEAAVGKLAHYRELAMKVMETTAQAIAVRQHLIAEGSQWVLDSKMVLQAWLKKQSALIAQRIATSVNQLKKLKHRADVVERIFKDAVEQHKQYLDAMHRMDLEEHIARLKNEHKTYSALKTTDPYDQAKNSAFLNALDLELKALEKRLSSIPGDGKVIPPPGVWGVLSNFHPIHTALWRGAPPLPPNTGSPPPDSSPTYPFPAVLGKSAVYRNGVPVDPTLGDFQPFGGVPSVALPSPHARASIQLVASSQAANQHVPPIAPELSPAVQADMSASFRSSSEYPSSVSSSPSSVYPSAVSSSPPAAAAPTSALAGPPTLPSLPPPPDATFVE